MNKKINLKEMFSKVVNNELSIKRMGMLYLFLPWLIFDFLVVGLVIASISLNSGILMTILIYGISPIFLLYLSFTSGLLLKKSLGLSHLMKKYAGISFFGTISILFALIAFSIVGLSLKNSFFV